MAVARVFGLVDGVEVILQKADEDRWNVPVPFDADGICGRGGGRR